MVAFVLRSPLWNYRGQVVSRFIWRQAWWYSFSSVEEWRKGRCKVQMELCMLAFVLHSGIIEDRQYQGLYGGRHGGIRCPQWVNCRKVGARFRWSYAWQHQFSTLDEWWKGRCKVHIEVDMVVDMVVFVLHSGRMEERQVQCLYGARHGSIPSEQA